MHALAALSTFALLAFSRFAAAAPVSSNITDVDTSLVESEPLEEFHSIEKRGFSKVNSGIGSWFRTNSKQDSTNGHSWCQTNYQDNWMGFAPSLAVMQGSGGHSYCGRQAKATNPHNGKTAYIYVVDAFAHPRSAGSVDLTLAAFKALYGSTTNNKNIVIGDLHWEFTGGFKKEYSFNGGR